MLARTRLCIFGCLPAMVVCEDGWMDGWMGDWKAGRVEGADGLVMQSFCCCY